MIKFNKNFRSRGCYVLLLLLQFLSTQVLADQQGEKITLKAKKISLYDAFKKIENQYTYIIAYDLSQVENKTVVDLHIESATIDKAMKELLKTTPLTFKINDKHIIIKKRKTVAPPKLKKEKTKVTGKIIDEKGDPIPFCNVYVENTTIGVVSELDGSYTIEHEAQSFNLIFSCIGFQKKTIKISGNANKDLQLKEEGVSMDEVVVTGYQKIDRKMFTGSAAKVTAEDTKVDGVSDVSRMLEGKVAGVSVQNVSGTFGAAPKIRVRGASSIYGDTKPLWVVDGVELEDIVDVSPDELSSGDATTLISSSVAGLNAEDIADYQILKDASATALHGARAMNGVIVITTKRGKKGKTNISFTSETTFREKPKYRNYDILNSKDQMSVFQELERKGWLNYADMKTTKSGGVYYKMYNQLGNVDETTGEFALKNNAKDRINYLRYYEMVNTNWFDQLFTNGVTQNYSLSLSGGGDKSRYYVSASYLNDSGWTIADEVDRYTLKMNADFDITNKLRVGIQSNSSIRQQQVPGTFGRTEDRVSGTISRDFDINPFSFAMNTSRTITPYAADGSLDYFKLNHADFNIIEEYDNNFIDISLLDLNAQLNLQYTFNDHLSFRIDGSLRHVHNENTHKIKENSNVAKSYRAADDATIKILNKYLYQDPAFPNHEKQVVLPYGGFFLQDNNNLTSYYIKNILTYNNTFAEIHSLNVLLGQELKSAERENTYFNGYGYQYDKGGTVFTDYRIMKQLIEANFPYFGNSINYDRHFAAFSNIAYGYNGKYMFNGTMRVDGSNQLGKSRSARYLPTWNVSAKYNISEEDFMRNIEWLSFLAIRGTYGLTAIMGPAPNSTVILQNAIAIRQFSHDKEPELKVAATANEDLTWEKQYETNIGFDIGVFNNRVSFSSDIYFRRSFDLIAPIKTSAVGGKYWKLANYADMKSDGFEFSLHTANIKNNDFSWDTNLTFAYSKNKITNLKNKPQLFDLIRPEGGALQGYPVRGLFSIPFAGLSEQGFPQYYDKDGNIVVGDINFQSGDVDYLKYEGQIDPKYIGGISNVFKYKALTLKIFTSYSFGNVLRLTPSYTAIHNDWSSVSKEMKNRWLLPGDEQKTNIPTIPSKRIFGSIEKLGIAYSAYNYSDQRVAKGDFIRLKEVSLAYDIPVKLISKSGIKKLSVKLQATNPLLLYSDKRLNGQDPEFFGAGGVALPVAKQYTLTLRMSL